MAEKIIKVENQSALATIGTKEISYSLGNGELIVLNEQVIRNLTNNNEKITQGEIQLFIEMCKYQHLNPLIKEAYLIKIDPTKPAQQVVALGAFMRIADENPSYEGIEDGVIVQTKNGEIIDRVGCVKYNGETLIGGWAKVYRSDRKIPFISRVDLKEYTKGQATWNQLPMVMINKVGKVSALRKAFPQAFNGMYVAEEIPTKDYSGIQSQPTINQDIVYDISIDDEIIDNTIIDNVQIKEPITEVADTKEAVVESEPKPTQKVSNDKPFENKSEDYEKIYYVTYPYYQEHKEALVKAGEYNQETKRLPVKKLKPKG
jgi:phage recombination protein Bet